MPDKPTLGALSPAVRGVAWMISAAFFYAFTFAAIRALSADFSVFEITFFRALFGVSFMTPWLVRAGLGALRTKRWKLFGLRAIVTYSGMVCWFYGLAHLKLANATAIMFTAPLLTVFCLSVALGERVGARRWAAILCGFAGALIIIRPGLVDLSLATGAVVFTAVSYGISNAQTRALASTEASNTVVFYMFALVLPLTLYPTYTTWTTPAWADLPLIAVFGVLSLISMQCITRSLAAAPGAVVMPLFYLQLPFVAGLGWLLFGESTDLWTWVGGAVICASGYYVVRLDARERAAARSEA